jgi:hypothetical protein
MDGSKPSAGPLRIELATSQIEGGQAVGWVDPDRVTGAVAFGEPRETFKEFVLPRLTDGVSAGEDVGSLPPGVSAMVTALKAAHLRLYKRNRTGEHGAQWVRATCACVEASRIYFVKTRASWIYLLREGRAHLVGREGIVPSVRGSAEALGGPEKLRMQVTSLEVTRDDQFLLVTGDADEPPDQRAIARLFAESSDLKRACDGLVNLLGLQGASASVVAFRFSPLVNVIEERHLDKARGEEVIVEITNLARDCVLAAKDDPGVQPEPILEMAHPPGPADKPVAPTLETSGSTAPQLAQPEAPPEPVFPQAAQPKPVFPQAAQPKPVFPQAAQPKPVFPQAAVPEAVPTPDPQPSPLAPAPSIPPKPRRETTRSRASALPILLIAALLFFIATVLLSGAGWPGLVETFQSLLGRVRGGPMTVAQYSLVDATSEPAGAIVSVDGEKLPGRTPLRGLRVTSGRRVVTLHLGAVGAWADTIDFVPGERHAIHAAFLGSLTIAACDTAGNPMAWLEGQTGKRSLPARFEDLPAGWYRMFFEDDRIPLWERKVLVRSGELTVIEVNNSIAEGQVLLHVESLRMIPSQGLRPSEGDSVFVNRSFVGLAPLELEVEPGLHAVRIVSDGQEHCEVLRLPAGASRFVTAQFGLRPRPVFKHRSPGRVVLQGPVLLAVEIDTERGGLRKPTLHLPTAEDGPSAVPLIEMDSGENLYVGKVEPSCARAGEILPYYFSVVTPDGDEAVSDLFEMTPVETPEQVAEAPVENVQ